MRNLKTLFFFARLPIALSLAFHGLVRLPKLQEFSGWMMKTMEKSMIPEFITLPFSYALPFLESIIGILLLIDYKSQEVIFAAIALMSVLIVGSFSIENWDAVSSQILHCLYLFALLIFINQVKPLVKISNI